MYGEEKVLSTIILMSGLMALTPLVTASMSMSLSVGLVGVSIQTNLVYFLTALIAFSVTLMSINSAYIPCFSAKNLLMYL